MTNDVLDNNKVIIKGKITDQPAFSHYVYGEGIYLCEIAVERLSNSVDLIQTLISERLMDMKKDHAGKEVEVQGQFRSYNNRIESKSKLMLSVFAKKISLLSGFQQYIVTNSIILNGFICKSPINRKTPLGRDITDIILAVNRPYGKSDYIPCICWGRNAHYAQALEVGSNIEISGRIQSREYEKKTSEYEYEKRIAYEISVSCLKLINTT